MDGRSFETMLETAFAATLKPGCLGSEEAATLAKIAMQRDGEGPLGYLFDAGWRINRAARQWRRIQELKSVAPYLRYSAVIDREVRAEHTILHGVIIAVDHPWWDRFYLPNAPDCRCTVMQVSERDLKECGWKVNDEEPPGDANAFAPGFDTNFGKTWDMSDYFPIQTFSRVT